MTQDKLDKLNKLRPLLLAIQQINNGTGNSLIPDVAGILNFNCYSPHQKTISTGILRKEINTYSAVIYAMNIDNLPQDVTVEVWNWTSFSNPQKLPVLIGNNTLVTFPYRLHPNNFASFFAFLTPANVRFYEVRIRYSGNRNVIFNSFGRSPALEAQEGDTVLQHQFNEVNPS
ncbi:hypothetical protein P4575_27570 [Priestia megaterium]|uniref:hypothetical protein n=1 Tax=Priestia megaterium TaxID=1404 RepID=UPI002EBC0573|nr:hypothetical protein [Priestia megaterium]